MVHVARMGEVRRSANGGFVGKTDRNRSLGRPSRGWKNIIKLDHEEIEMLGVKWTDLAENRAT